jgi:HEAT repeat protein
VVIAMIQCLPRLALPVAVFAAVSFGGCQRTPPSPARIKAPAAKPQDDNLLVSAEAQPLPPAGARRVIRDEAVAPASLEVVVPAPKSEQQLAADALTRIGPPAVPMLIEALRSGDGQVRREACAVLMRMGPDAKEAVPDLVRLLEDDDEELRRMAAIALGRIGPDAGEAVPALMRSLLQGQPATPR